MVFRGWAVVAVGLAESLEFLAEPFGVAGAGGVQKSGACGGEVVVMAVFGRVGEEGEDSFRLAAADLRAGVGGEDGVVLGHPAGEGDLGAGVGEGVGAADVEPAGGGCVGAADGVALDDVGEQPQLHHVGG